MESFGLLYEVRRGRETADVREKEKSEGRRRLLPHFKALVLPILSSPSLLLEYTFSVSVRYRLCFAHSTSKTVEGIRKKLETVKNKERGEYLGWETRDL